MATHSSTFVWRIPWTEEPGRLQSMTSQRVGHICVSFTAVFGKVRNLNVGTHRAHPDKISPYSVTYNREKLEVCGSQQTVENS